ncbi:hypothetical protein INT44_006596 [Umbelopsis vinacea]|uniref:Uncharacterized protein n=1 Tax=Umbelopsis vinacea TaxID=44442 RepID=A0A8H7PT78_9FUNG|nr:hypothetical protein INT44_006596 [Umbelopsis vinacea]
MWGCLFKRDVFYFSEAFFPSQDRSRSGISTEYTPRFEALPHRDPVTERHSVFTVHKQHLLPVPTVYPFPAFFFSHLGSNGVQAIASTSQTTVGVSSTSVT